MDWTPRRIAAVLFVDSKLEAQERRQRLGDNAFAAQGDPKALQRVLGRPEP